MIEILKTVIALTVGAMSGWWLLDGFCKLPSLKYSNACGHNAYLWIPIFIPLCVYLCWLTLDFLIGRLKRNYDQEKTK